MFILFSTTQLLPFSPTERLESPQGTSYQISNYITEETTFYTSDNSRIQTVPLERSYRKPDPKAPLPNIKKYKIEYVGHPIAIILGVIKVYKVDPHHVITFYDKHNNAVKWFRYNPSKRLIGPGVGPFKTEQAETIDQSTKTLGQALKLNLESINISKEPVEPYCSIS